MERYTISIPRTLSRDGWAIRDDFHVEVWDLPEVFVTGQMSQKAGKRVPAIGGGA